MVALDKNHLRYITEVFELEGHIATDCLTPQAASVSWEYIHTLIQECTIAKDLKASRHIQNLIIFHGLDSFTFCSDHLIRLYASCTHLGEANAVFCRVSRPSCYTWTAIITAHADLGDYNTAVRLFERMQSDGLIPNKCLLLCILKVCCDESYSCLGNLVQDQIVRVKLESDVAIGSLLVRVHGQHGCLHEARWIFDNLAARRDTILWSAMVTAYSGNGHYHVALNLVDQMLREGTNPDNVTFLCMLKACSSTRALEEGQLIHNLLIRYGLESDVIMGSSLIDMYGKCERLNEAQCTFHMIHHKNTVSWNSLIAIYAQLGFSSIELFNQMQEEEFVADKATFLSVLKSCGAIGAFEHGARIHDQIAWYGLEGDTLIASALVGMYAKCGRLQEADGLFDKMAIKDVIVWGELIGGYAGAGLGHFALDLFKKMQDVGITPIKVTFLHALKACISIGNIDEVRLINDEIVMYGFESDNAVGSSLVDLYAKYTQLDDARIMFGNLPRQDVVSWGTLIAAYAGNDNFAAFEVFQQMQQQGVDADKLIYLCIMKACGTECTVVHAWIVHFVFTERNSRVDMDLANALVDMYAKCGFPDDACKAFESSPYQDASSWSVLITACVENGFPELAFRSFTKLQELGLTPDSATIGCILKACGNAEDIRQGRLVHDHLIADSIYLQSMIGNPLISMYFKCGLSREAAHVFEQVRSPDGVSWDSMIAGYSQHGHGLSALEYFQKMQEQGATPGSSTFACALKACGIEGLASQGRLLHDRLVRNGLEKEMVVGNALVDMYAKCGGLIDAQKVFMNMTLRDEVSWGAILCCNSLNGDPSNVLQLYARMQLDGIKPDKVTVSSAANACSNIGVLKVGRLIHDQAIRCGIEADVVVGTTLVDMYAKYFSSQEAQKAFSRIEHVNEASWTALLSASVQDGQIQHMKGLVNDLRTQGFIPDNQTCTNILTAWTRSGQSKATSEYVEDVMEGHAFAPAIDHFNCVIDSLSRVGRLHEAEEVLLTMPMPPDIIGWVSLLTACQTFGNTNVGAECLDHVARLNLSGTGSYVMMANMYADAQNWCKVSNVLDIRKSVGAWKLPGQAWLELAEGIHVFNISEGSCSEGEACNFKAVRTKMREQGFIPQVDLVLGGSLKLKEVSEALSCNFSNQTVHSSPTLPTCVESC